MPCTLRKPALHESLPPTLGRSRLERLQDLVNGTWGDKDSICLVYWNSDENRWVSWFDGPSPTVDPFKESQITISP